MARLGDVCTKAASNIAQKDLKSHPGNYPIYGASGFITNVDFYQQEKPYIAVVKDGAGVGRIMKLPAKSSVIGTMQYILPNENIDIGYLAYAMEHMNLSKYFTGATIPHIYFKDYQKEELRLPSLDGQRNAAAVLDKVNSLISLRKQQLAKLDELVKARFVEMFGDVSNGSKHPGIPLGEICSTLSGGTPTTKVPEYYQGDIPWISTPYLGDNHINGRNAKAYITQDAIKNSATHLIPKNTIVFGIRVGVGKSSIIDDAMCTNQDIVALMNVNSHKYNLLFLKHVLDSYQSYFNSIKKGATILGITTDDLKKVVVPNVELDLQEQFAAFVDQTDKSKLTIQKSLAKLEVLKKSLMQKYFG